MLSSIPSNIGIRTVCHDGELFLISDAAANGVPPKIRGAVVVVEDAPGSPWAIWPERLWRVASTTLGFAGNRLLGRYICRAVVENWSSRGKSSQEEDMGKV